jgi:C4-dicarboxylate-specific signal transduction histidine kinase
VVISAWTMQIQPFDAFREKSVEELCMHLRALAVRRPRTSRSSESDLARANRIGMIEALSASVAHEVRQPIAAARNNARAALNFLQLKPADQGEATEAVRCLLEDVDRACEIIDRIGEQIKNAPPRNEPCSLNRIVEEVLGFAGSTILKDVAVTIRLEKGPCTVFGDRIRLQQVLLNLILNAVEAMGAAGAQKRELAISTAQDRALVRATVGDCGPGIPPNCFERIFQPFYTTKSGGTGLGLPVCRSIVEAHKGKLWATANKPCGALFHLTLPSGAGKSCVASSQYS